LKGIINFSQQICSFAYYSDCDHCRIVCRIEHETGNYTQYRGADTNSNNRLSWSGIGGGG
jgi:hypothetical protein